MIRHASLRYTLALPVAFCLLFAALGLAAPARAADVTQTFELNNVTFDDGSTATGTFTYDFTQDAITSASISAGGPNYSTTYTSAQVSGTTNSLSAVIDGNDVFDLEIAFAKNLTATTGSPITINAASSYIVVDTTNQPGGGVSATYTITGGSIIPFSALPTTTAAYVGTAGKNGWYTGPVTVTLTAKAVSKPIAATYYTLDGGAQQTYTAPFTVTAQAGHAFTFWSVDTGGNVEFTHTATIKIDGTPPVTTISAANQAMVLTATDNVSGVAGTYFTVDGGPKTTYTGPYPLSIKTHAIRWYSKDVAGNNEVIHSASLVVPDATPPSAPTNLAVIGYTANSIILGWTASTDNVGVTGYNVYSTYGHSGRGGGYSTYLVGSSSTNTVAVPANRSVNSYNYTVYALDAAGNKSGPSNEIYVIGPVLPSLTRPVTSGERGPDAVLGSIFGVIEPALNPQWSAYVVTPSGNPAPTLSIVNGPAGMTVDSATGTVTWIPSGTPGTYTATVHAASSIGTFDYPFTYTVYAAGTDLLPPSTPSMPPSASNITSTSATLTWPAATDNVGVVSYTITLLANNIWTTYKTPTNATTYTITGLTPNTLCYASVAAEDAAGNMGWGTSEGIFTTLP